MFIPSFSKRTLLAALAVASLSGWSGLAAAQAAPIKLLVGFPPGGSADVIARVISEKLSASLGATVIVENKPGAGGRIAAELLKSAPADGNTILITPMAPVLIAPLTFSKLNYKPDADFAPVAQLAKFHLMLAVGGNSPHKTLADLVNAYKADPKTANFGTSAAGSLPHFLGMMVGIASGAQVVHVPYQGGAPLMNDLMGGQVPAAIDTLEVNLHKAGKIRMLATSGPTRSSFMPEVPTFREQGYPNVVGEGWFGAYVPKATPAATVQKISAALVAAIKAADIKPKLDGIGAEATGQNAAEFTAQIAADTARWKPVVDSTGFKGD